MAPVGGREVVYGGRYSRNVTTGRVVKRAAAGVGGTGSEREMSMSTDERERGRGQRLGRSKEWDRTARLGACWVRFYSCTTILVSDTR